jgi:hypothetical protein
MIRNADFHDSCRAPLSRGQFGIAEIFFAVFGPKPLWIKLLYLALIKPLHRYGVQLLISKAVAAKRR